MTMLCSRWRPTLHRHKVAQKKVTKNEKCSGIVVPKRSEKDTAGIFLKVQSVMSDNK